VQAANTARNKARSAQNRLRSNESDALSALYALLEYDALPAGNRDAFCKDNFLHPTNLREMSALRRQLARVLRMKPALEACGRSNHAGAQALLQRCVLVVTSVCSVDVLHQHNVRLSQRHGNTIMLPLRRRLVCSSTTLQVPELLRVALVSGPCCRSSAQQCSLRCSR
jgi:hypothetical protein